VQVNLYDVTNERILEDHPDLVVLVNSDLVVAPANAVAKAG